MMTRGALDSPGKMAPSGGRHQTPPFTASEPPSDSSGIANVPLGQEGVRRRLNAGGQPLRINGGPDRDKVGR